MALTYKKLSELTDMTASSIDATTKLVVTTGVSKTNNNLKVSDLVVDDLVTSNSYRALSAKMGKKLQDEKAPIANPIFTGTVSGITKSMVGLGNVDNTSDANKPISTLQAAGLAPKANPTFTGNVVVPAGDASNEAVNKGQLDLKFDLYVQASNSGGNIASTKNQMHIFTSSTDFDLSVNGEQPVGSIFIFKKIADPTVTIFNVGTCTLDGVDIDTGLSGTAHTITGSYATLTIYKISETAWVTI